MLVVNRESSVLFRPMIPCPRYSLGGRTVEVEYQWDSFVFDQFPGLLSPFDYSDFKDLKTHPAACKLIECNSLCGGHCWAEGANGCQRCPAGQVLSQGTCKVPANIPANYFLDGWVAKPCALTCASCTGPADTECSSCSGSRYLLPSGACAFSCGKGYYPDANNVCQTCDSAVSCSAGLLFFFGRCQVVAI